MNTKRIIMPTILLAGMILLTIGSAAATNIQGQVYWSNGTPCTPLITSGMVEMNVSGTIYDQGTTPPVVLMMAEWYTLALNFGTQLNNGDVIRYNVSCGGETNTTASFTYNGGGPDTTFDIYLVAPTGQPDLIVEDITPSGTITNFGSGNVYGLFLANESNDICVNVTNRGTGDAGAFTVEFDVSGTLYTTTVPGLGAGITTTVCITDTVARPAGTATMTIDVEADSTGVVFESSESNNTVSLTCDILNNGYKGKRYTGGSDIKEYKEFCVNGSVNYSAGDSYYLGNSGDPTWTHFNVTWDTSTDPLPNGTTLVEARLYVPYCWAAVNWSQNLSTYTSMTFNGNNVPMDMNSPGFSLGDYWDAKLYDPAATQYGTIVYNVTGDYNTTNNAINNASFENTYPGNVSMRGMLLVVVYDDGSNTTRRIVLNEGFDMLCAYPDRYATTSAEATAWAPFDADSGCCMRAEAARLITFAPGAGGSGGAGEGELIFNNDTIAYDAWTRLANTQIGVSDVAVTSYLQSTNEAGFQSNESHDWMEAMVAILEVECRSAVTVEIDPCPAFVYPGGNTTVNITLSGITDYGSGTICLDCCDPCPNSSAAYAIVESVGFGDSGSVTHSPLGGCSVCISASSAAGLSGDVVFATVTLEPMGNPGDCICLNLTVNTLYNTNFAPLPTVAADCCPGLHIIENDPPLIVSAIADPPLIYNNSCPPCPRCTNLTVLVTDATSVEEVWVDLTPLGVCGPQPVKMCGPDGAKSGVWHYKTCANYSSLATYQLYVTATDLHGNPANGLIPLEVQRVGDVNHDNMVNMADYLIIARYTVGLVPLPDPCRSDLVPPGSPDGIIDMGDALYIAMYATWNPIPGFPEPGSQCPCPCPCPYLCP